ncbi:MAG: hypothetical protein HC896_14710 [Bacteroidales bacterium]|nr:hypothetical protein [Bacteroidales bacterium]
MDIFRGRDFWPGRNNLAAEYTPDTSVISNGTVSLMLVSTNNKGCQAQQDSLMLEIIHAPQVTVRSDTGACENIDSLRLWGSVSQGATKGRWTSSGTGLFVPGDSAFNATYAFGASDVLSDTLYIVLTSVDNGLCLPVKDSLMVLIEKFAIVEAGSHDTVCMTDTLVNLNGSILSKSRSGLWSTSGFGSFLPSAADTLASYVFDKADTVFESLTFFLASTNHVYCPPMQDSVEISRQQVANIYLANDTSLCSSAPQLTMSAVISGGASSGQWSYGGSGSFSPSSTTLQNVVFTPANQDINLDSVSLVTLFISTTNHGACPINTDSIQVRYLPEPSADAGSSDTICANNNVYPLNGAISGGTAKGIWSATGDGVFSPADTALLASYNIGSQDINNQYVLLRLTSRDNGGCQPAKDSIYLYITKTPVINLSDDAYICINNASHTITGSIQGGASQGMWTSSKNGAFYAFSIRSAMVSYVPSASEISNDTVLSTVVYLTSTDHGDCPEVKDSVTLIYLPVPQVEAGNDLTACNNGVPIDIAGFVNSNIIKYRWHTLGDGIFEPTDTLLSTAYLPGVNDTTVLLVNVVLSTVALGNCPETTDTVTISLAKAPLANAGEDMLAITSRVALNGIVYNAQGGKWSTLGKGTFLPYDTLLTAQYEFNYNEIVNEVPVSLILTTVGSPYCESHADTVLVTNVKVGCQMLLPPMVTA